MLSRLAAPAVVAEAVVLVDGQAADVEPETADLVLAGQLFHLAEGEIGVAGAEAHPGGAVPAGGVGQVAVLVADQPFRMLAAGPVVVADRVVGDGLDAAPGALGDLLTEVVDFRLVVGTELGRPQHEAVVVLGQEVDHLEADLLPGGGGGGGVEVRAVLHPGGGNEVWHPANEVFPQPGRCRFDGHPRPLRDRIE